MSICAGDVVQLGPHRLMCGDAGNPEHVAALFQGVKPDLVFTSPPYLQQRDYGQATECWDTLMQRAFGAMPWHDTTQVLVNLGLVHRDGEWQSYWDGWVAWMRTQGWRRFGWYVWDKKNGMPGNWNGRLASSFEFIFHFNKACRYPNKIVPCKPASIGRIQTGKAMRNNKFGKQSWDHLGTKSVNTHKIPDATIRLSPEKANKTGHTGVFPVSLASFAQTAYANPGDCVYDPFAGSGTSIIAAEAEGRICFGMEIEPLYCEVAIERWRKRKPMQSTLAV